MSSFRVIDLAGVNSGTSAVQFLYAEAIEDFDAPLVVVRCKVSWGPLQERGLRLDLDKMAFIDRLDNEEADKAIANAAPEIVKQLSTVSYKISVV